MEPIQENLRPSNLASFTPKSGSIGTPLVSAAMTEPSRSDAL